MDDKIFRFLVFILLIFVSAPNVAIGEYGDIILNKKATSMRKAGVKDVLFPHWFHRIRFKCKVCHEDIFVMRAGFNDMNMKKIMNGEQCGKCHNGIIAWEPLFCDRCHMQEPGWTSGVMQKSKRVK